MGQTSNRARNQNRMLQVVQSTDLGHDLGRYLFSEGTTFEILSPPELILNNYYL
jgi:hypothetical protein